VRRRADNGRNTAVGRLISKRNTPSGQEKPAEAFEAVAELQWADPPDQLRIACDLPPGSRPMRSIAHVPGVKMTACPR
jgi:hypothetical protein